MMEDSENRWSHVDKQAPYQAPIDPEKMDFAVLCVPLHDALMRKALLLTREPESARDLVQNTYVRGLRAWGQFHVAPGEDPADRAGAWMWRLLMNQFLSDCRASCYRAKQLAFAADEITESSMSPPPPSTDAMIGLTREFRRAILSVSPEHSRTVIAHDLHGRSDIEIATEMGVSPTTIRTRLSRGRAAIATVLNRSEVRAMRRRAYL